MECKKVGHVGPDGDTKKYIYVRTDPQLMQKYPVKPSCFDVILTFLSLDMISETRKCLKYGFTTPKYSEIRQAESFLESLPQAFI